MPAQPAVIVISGPPGSGRRALAGRLQAGRSPRSVDLADRAQARVAARDPAALLGTLPVVVLAAERVPLLVTAAVREARRPGDVVLVTEVRPERLPASVALL